MKIPKRIKELIYKIEETELLCRGMWNELYNYLDGIGVDSDSDLVSNLQDGVGGKELIESIENRR